MGIKFNRHSEEEICAKTIDGSDTDPRYKTYGGIICMRSAGHQPPCIALACDAAEADGVCHSCRHPKGAIHRFDCTNK